MIRIKLEKGQNIWKFTLKLQQINKFKYIQHVNDDKTILL